MNNKCYLIDVYSVLQEAHISLRGIDMYFKSACRFTRAVINDVGQTQIEGQTLVDKWNYQFDACKARK